MVHLPISLIQACIGWRIGRDGVPLLDTTAAFDGEPGGMTWTFFSMRPFACERSSERS
jgi:hypothetical protein